MYEVVVGIVCFEVEGIVEIVVWFDVVEVQCVDVCFG